MEESKKKEGILLRLFQKLSSSKLSIKEYAFAIMVTLIEIGTSFIYELIRGDNASGLQIPITGIILFIIFFLIWKPDEFIQINFVEFIYFQIVTVVGTLVLVLPAVFYYREDIKKLYGLQIPYFEGRVQGVVLILLVLLIVVISFIFYEVLAGIIFWTYVQRCHKDFKNSYFEKIKAVQNLEEYKVYQRRKLREAYEKMAYEKMAYERMAHENVYQPKPLFENTKYFKQITDIEQVKPRYHAIMKIYHPDNPGGSVEISQEIQKEYQAIARKYNL